jgi:hypothetical protein
MHVNLAELCSDFVRKVFSFAWETLDLYLKLETEAADAGRPSSEFFTVVTGR